MSRALNWHWHDKLSFVTAELFESPKELPDMAFSLDSAEESAKRLATLKACPDLKEVDKFENIPIFACTDEGGKKFVFAEVGGRLAYFVTWEDRAFPGSRERYVTQVAIQRYRLTPTQGISKYVFWNILFPKHHAIMTDNAQTRLGREFWRDRVADALQRAIPIYFIDLSKPAARQLRSAQDYEQAAIEAYGRADRHKDLRLLITTQPLDAPVVESKVSVPTPCYV